MSFFSHEEDSTNSHTRRWRTALLQDRRDSKMLTPDEQSALDEELAKLKAKSDAEHWKGVRAKEREPMYWGIIGILAIVAISFWANNSLLKESAARVHKDVASIQTEVDDLSSTIYDLD